MEANLNPMEKTLVIKFYEKLFARAYEIMFDTQMRRVQKRSQQKKGVTSQYFDDEGDKELASSFEQVFE